MDLIIAGFRLECKGYWLGEYNASEWLVLDFQPSNSIPGDGLTEAWIHNFELFMNKNTQEIGTIFDRLPLDEVKPGALSR